MRKTIVLGDAPYEPVVAEGSRTIRVSSAVRRRRSGLLGAVLVSSGGLWLLGLALGMPSARLPLAITGACVLLAYGIGFAVRWWRLPVETWITREDDEIQVVHQLSGGTRTEATHSDLVISLEMGHLNFFAARTRFSAVWLRTPTHNLALAAMPTADEAESCMGVCARVLGVQQAQIPWERNAL